MSLETSLIFLGILVFLSPFSGLPLSLLSWILPLLGVVIVSIAVSLRAKHQIQKTPHTDIELHDSLAA